MINSIDQLARAIETHDNCAVSSILRKGDFDINDTVDGETLLTVALCYHNLSIVSELLAAGLDINQLNKDGTSNLFWAVSLSDDAIVHQLIQAGARLEGEQPNDGYTALHAAAESGFTEIVSQLLAVGGECLLEKTDYLGRTAVACAVKSGESATVRTLIEHGADVNTADEECAADPPIIMAIRKDNAEILQLLLEAGADPRRPGRMMLSAVDHALRSEKPNAKRIRRMLTRYTRGAGK